VNLIYKGQGAKLENVDTKEGIIQVYVSAFNSKDSDGDIIVPGAYTKTLSEWGPQAKNRVWFLKNHDTSKEIAKPFEIKQDNYGLLFSVKLPQTTMGKDMLALYSEGHITEHSVGFIAVMQQKRTDYNEINEIKLYEGSAVLWGANENTPTVLVKSLLGSTPLENIDDEISKTFKSIRNWKGSEEGFELLELKAEQLFALKGNKPGEPLIQTVEPLDLKAASEALAVIETQFINSKFNGTYRSN
jgi:hypothetical protein